MREGSQEALLATLERRTSMQARSQWEDDAQASAASLIPSTSGADGGFKRRSTWGPSLNAPHLGVAG